MNQELEKLIEEAKGHIADKGYHLHLRSFLTEAFRLGELSGIDIARERVKGLSKVGDRSLDTLRSQITKGEQVDSPSQEG